MAYPLTERDIVDSVGEWLSDNKYGIEDKHYDTTSGDDIRAVSSPFLTRRFFVRCSADSSPSLSENR